MHSALLTIPTLELLKLWGELVECYHGIHGYGDVVHYSLGGDSFTTVHVIGWHEKFQGEWWISCKECKAPVSRLFFILPVTAETVY